jgi:hypothetical protein
MFQLFYKSFDDKFRQLDELLAAHFPHPSTTNSASWMNRNRRTASGAPGHAYWQQRADYKIRATLNEAERSITGTETVTYHNNSPDTLNYLWLQLDQNIYARDSDARMMQTAPSREAWTKPVGDAGFKYDGMRSILVGDEFDGGFKLSNLKGSNGAPLAHTVNRTMMRIDLPAAETGPELQLLAGLDLQDQ